MNSYNLLSIKTCNFLLLSFKTVVTRKIWEIYEVKDFALSMRKFSANAILKQNDANNAEQDHYFSWPEAEMKIRKKGCY